MLNAGCRTLHAGCWTGAKGRPGKLSLAGASSRTAVLAQRQVRAAVVVAKMGRPAVQSSWCGRCGRRAAKVDGNDAARTEIAILGIYAFGYGLSRTGQAPGHWEASRRMRSGLGIASLVGRCGRDSRQAPASRACVPSPHQQPLPDAVPRPCPRPRPLLQCSSPEVQATVLPRPKA
jgi:hypothetical protein